jgi:hypothetical protein
MTYLPYPRGAGVWLEHAMVADRCFASFDDLMRPGGMRPK